MIEETKDSDYEIIQENLYDVSNGIYCGVILKEDVMKKLLKLQTKHLEEVKKLLYNNKESLYPSEWTLHHPEGKQTVVHFTGYPYESVEKRIDNLTLAMQPKYLPLVFKAKNMEEAARMADAYYKATHIIENNEE